MKKYFIHDENDSHGPFDFEELKTKKIKPNDMIWFEGLEDWKEAKEIEELKELFKVTIPPPFKRVIVAENKPVLINKKQFHIKDYYQIILILIFILSVIIYKVAASKESDPFKDSTTNTTTTTSPPASIVTNDEELKRQLERTEITYPTSYLINQDEKMVVNRVRTRSPDFFHHSEYKDDGYILTGSIKNNATIAKYKDVKIKVEYYSKTNSVIDSNEFIIYKVIAPYGTVYYSYKVYSPEETSSYKVVVVNAKPAY